MIESKSFVFYARVFVLALLVSLLPNIVIAAPSTPSAPSVSATGATSLDISWSSVSSATEYKLFRSTSSSGTYTQIYWGSSRSYTDSGTHLSSSTRYYYKVKAGNSSGWSSYSSYGYDTTWAPIPSTPSSPSVSATGATSLDISWSSVTDATEYKLYRATSSSGSYTQIYWGSSRSYTDSGTHLSSSTRYYYKVKAGNSSGWSGYSSYGYDTTWAPTPSTPSAPSVSATSSTSIDITWSSVSGATEYKLYRSTSSSGTYTQIYWGSSRSYTDSGTHLSASTRYYYKVTAGNSSGWSSYSSYGYDTTWAAIPSTPSAPTVSATGATSLTISWSSVSGATEYKLYRSTSSSGTYTQVYWGSSRSYTDSGSHLSASTRYYYKVTAGNSSGWSSYSSYGYDTTWAAIPSTPSAPSVSATGPTSIDISWSSVSGATEYKLYRSTSSSGTYTQIYWGSSRSYTDSGTHLSASTRYYYKVTAGNSSGWSGYSSASSDTTWAAIPSTPSAPTVSATGATSIDISWSSVSGATEYKLYRSTSSSGTYTQIYWGTDLTYTDSGTHLSAATTYYYKVTAGNVSGYSGYSSASSATTWAAVPAAPAAPAVSATSSTSINISWTAVTGATEYKLYRATSSGGTFTQIYWNTDFSYTDSGTHLSAGTTYYYVVTAGNSSGHSSYSSESSVATWAAVPSAPSAPTVSATSSTSIAISWTAVTGATEYKLYRSTSSSGTYTQIYWDTDLSYTDSGTHLSPSTTYYYKVTAGNSSGWSGDSSVSNATTWVDIPAIPSTPTVSATGTTSIDISWTAVTDATEYKLYRSTSSSGTYTQIYWNTDVSYTDSGSHLSPATTYYYKVMAGNISGWSDYSSDASDTTTDATLARTSSSATSLASSSNFVWPIGDGTLSGDDSYEIWVDFDTSRADGYCSTDYTLSESACTGTWMYGHDGLDFNQVDSDGDCDNPIYASADGTVVYTHTYDTAGWGKHVWVEHTDTDEGTLYTHYAHLNTVSVLTGDTVEKGTTEIGLLGGTGGWGCHLHFSVTSSDPLISGHGNGYYYSSGVPSTYRDPFALMTDISWRENSDLGYLNPFWQATGTAAEDIYITPFEKWAQTVMALFLFGKMVLLKVLNPMAHQLLILLSLTTIVTVLPSKLLSNNTQVVLRRVL